MADETIDQLRELLGFAQNEQSQWQHAALLAAARADKAERELAEARKFIATYDAWDKRDREGPDCIAGKLFDAMIAARKAIESAKDTE